MRALSKRDWNNVIIFAVLGLMLIFYLIPAQLEKNRQQPIQVLPSDALLLQIDYGQTRLVQAGAGQWQFQPAQPQWPAATTVLAAWQQLQLTALPQSPQLPTQPLARAAVLLHAQPQPQQWWLYAIQTAGETAFFLQRQGQPAIYAVTAEQVPLLFPNHR